MYPLILTLQYLDQRFENRSKGNWIVQKNNSRLILEKDILGLSSLKKYLKHELFSRIISLGGQVGQIWINRVSQYLK